MWNRTFFRENYLELASGFDSCGNKNLSEKPYKKDLVAEESKAVAGSFIIFGELLPRDNHSSKY